MMPTEELRRMFQQAEVNREIARLRRWLTVVSWACLFLLAALAGVLIPLLRGKL